MEGTKVYVIFSRGYEFEVEAAVTEENIDAFIDTKKDELKMSLERFIEKKKLEDPGMVIEVPLHFKHDKTNNIFGFYVSIRDSDKIYPLNYAEDYSYYVKFLWGPK